MPANAPRLSQLSLACALACSLALASPLTTLAQGTAPAAPAAKSGEDQITLNFVNADIPSVAKAIGGPLGKTFIFDPNVTGSVNIVSDKPVSKDLAYHIFLAAIRLQGFTAVEGNGFVKIVKEADAKLTGGANDGKDAKSASQVMGDRIITQVFQLQNESAAQLATVLRPLISPNNYLAAYPGNNTLVITDYAENVRRISRIIASIDVPASTDVQVIRLQYASAVDVGNLLQRLMPETNVNPASPGTPPKLVIGVDPRSNSLLVRADSPAITTRLKALVAGMDIPTAANGNIHVVYLRNAEATKLAETLRSLMAGEQKSVTQPTTTTATAGTATASGTTQQTVAAPASTIQAYAATNSLVITAPDHVYNSLRAVIDKLDTRRAQVAIEALIVEVSTTMATEFGIQWQDLSGLNRTNGAQIIGGTNFGGPGQNIISSAANLATLGQGLNLGIVRGTVKIGDTEFLSLGALARAFEGDTRANILSKPVITTLDNEEGKIIVGQNVPFVTGSFTQTANSSTNPFQTIERRDIGLTLKVTPQVAEGGAVKMKVFQEVSSVAPANNTVKSADLITNKRSIENTVLVDDGDIVVIGGLISDDTKNNDTQVPILGDIPVLGNLFKYKSKSRDKTNLMVFLRPVVLRDGKAAAQLTGERYEYIRNQQGAFNKENSGVLAPLGGAELPAFTAPAAASTAPAPKAGGK
ncbi:MAG: type II secretion system secretin GspD [Betaproteobacteria bacterium]|nr:type II secretion system secretin GspD [Betaproteobacteria bacterium]